LDDIQDIWQISQSFSIIHGNPPLLKVIYFPPQRLWRTGP